VFYITDRLAYGPFAQSFLLYTTLRYIKCTVNQQVISHNNKYDSINYTKLLQQPHNSLLHIRDLIAGTELQVLLISEKWSCIALVTRRLMS
jgi:hypothetical protein